MVWLAKKIRTAPKSSARISPGQMYKEIAVRKVGFGEGEKDEMKKRELNRYVRFCRNAYKRFPSFGKGAKFKEKYKDAVDFLGWDLKPEEFSAAIKLVMYLSIIAAAIAGIALYFLFGKLLSAIAPAQLVPLYIFAPLILAAIFLTYYVQNYPFSAAKLEEMRALTYIPEIIGYMIMSMKLSPNLEKAVEFSAEHGEGKIADDFRRLIWDVQLGVYLTLSEGLDELAYRWGKFSAEFKQGLMMIRASVLEDTEAKRYALLDKTMTSILDMIRTKMEEYARDLSQPSIVLFYIGILLPLILIIILPVGSSFSGAPLARPEIMFAIYNVAIPLVAFLFARRLIMQRPPTYEAPKIEDDFPGLPKKGTMKIGKAYASVAVIVAVVLIAGFASSYLVHEFGIQGLVPKDQTLKSVMDRQGRAENYYEPGGQLERQILLTGASAEAARKEIIVERQKFFMHPENDITPYNLMFGALITVALCVFIYLNFTNTYKRKLQKDIMQMESEFKDSIYVLASRMGENRPVEEALKHAKEFLPNYKISERIFGRIVDNITLLGMPLEAAVFDPNYGAMKNNPSKIISSSMRLLIDSVGLGVNVAARTMMSLSMQLSNSEKVSKMLRILVQDVTSMMRTVSIFIAPIVLGITTSLQKVVVVTLGAIASGPALPTAGALTNIPGLPGIAGFSSGNFGMAFKPEAFAQMASPAQFLLIVALYVIELVVIMTYFTTKIEEDNNTLVKMNIAKALPIAMIMFVISVVIANTMIGGVLG